MSFLFQVSARVTTKPDKPLVIVIVNSSIYYAIGSSLDQYRENVESTGFSVNIVSTDQMVPATPQGIRSFLQQAMTQDLVGVVLVGNIPTAWFKISDKSFPTDMYYRDLDGVWVDSDGDGVYDKHSGDTSPEIWVGRLKCPTTTGSEATLLNNYFTKNDRFRRGLRVLPWWRALAYIDDDGVDYAEEVRSSLSQVCSDVTLVTNTTQTTATDYENQLSDRFGYEWLYLMCHGDFDYQVFMINGSLNGGTVYPREYESIDPRVMFYIMFGCSGARFTEQDYLAGAEIFADTYGLISIGCTDTMYSFSLRRFFAALSEGKTVGTALQEWFLQEDGLQDQNLDNSSFQFVFYGLTICGDPTLEPCGHRKVALHDISISDVLYDITNADGGSTVHIRLFVQNSGDFNETFCVSIKMDYYTLADSKVYLQSKSVRIVDLFVQEPYRVTAVNHSKTTVSAVLSSIPEEFNLADNARSLILENVVVAPPTVFFDASRWEWLVITFAIFLLIPYSVFKALASERLFLSKYWVKLREVLAKNRR